MTPQAREAAGPARVSIVGAIFGAVAGVGLAAGGLTVADREMAAGARGLLRFLWLPGVSVGLLAGGLVGSRWPGWYTPVSLADGSDNVEEPAAPAARGNSEGRPTPVQPPSTPSRLGDSRLGGCLGGALIGGTVAGVVVFGLLKVIASTSPADGRARGVGFVVGLGLFGAVAVGGAVGALIGILSAQSAGPPDEGAE